MAHFCAAVPAMCSILNLPDPWDQFPALDDRAKGLKKTASTREQRKEGIAMNMLKLLWFWAGSQCGYRQSQNNQLATTILQNMVAVMLGFFSMRQAADCFLSKGWRMGLHLGDLQVHH